MRTLEDYLKEYDTWRPTWFFRSEYVTHPGWRLLYVRAGRAYIDGKWYDACFTLATIEAEEPGTGTFNTLITWFRERYNWPIIVECVQTPRFMSYLLRNGFVETNVPRKVVLW